MQKLIETERERGIVRIFATRDFFFILARVVKTLGAASYCTVHSHLNMIVYMFKLPINPQYSMTMGTHIRFAAGRTTQQRGPQKITTDERRRRPRRRRTETHSNRTEYSCIPSESGPYRPPISHSHSQRLHYSVQYYHSTVSLVSTLLKSPHSQASSGVLSGIRNTVAHVLTVHPFTVLYSCTFST